MLGRERIEKGERKGKKPQKGIFVILTENPKIIKMPFNT